MASVAEAPHTRRDRRKRRHPRPIALYLTIIAVASLVPTFLFSAILLQRNNQTQEDIVETLITATARSIVQSVDREINANVTTLKVLGTTPSLLRRDFRSFHDRVSAALAGTGNFVFVVDRDMTSTLNTRTPFEGQQTVAIADTQTAQRAFGTGDVAVSDGVYGSVSKQWVINILMPVTPVDADRPMLLGFSRSAAALSSALLSSRIPDGWEVALIDRSGHILAGSPASGSSGDTFSLLDRAEMATTPGWRPVTHDGEDYLVVTQRSLMTGWTLVMWAEENVVTAPLSEAFWSLLAGGLLLAALIAVVLYYLSLQIGRSVHGLQRDAKRLGSGQPVEAREFPISEIATVSEALGDASRQRQAAETEVRFLMRELAHRSKNQMTVIAAMAKQTARGADSVPEFVSSFEKRIFGLARSTDLLLAHGGAGVDLRELLVGQIDPFCPVESGRVDLEGPATRINAQAAQILGMAAHELATNAVKHGAFSVDSGRVAISWHNEGDRLAFTWKETGSSPGPETYRRGFGTTVLENMVGRSLSGEVTREVHEDGLGWTFNLPMSSLEPDYAGNNVGRFKPRSDRPRN